MKNYRTFYFWLYVGLTLLNFVFFTVDMHLHNVLGCLFQLVLMCVCGFTAWMHWYLGNQGR